MHNKPAYNHPPHCLGGASGIGLAAAKILAGKGATVHILDINPPTPDELPAALTTAVHFHKCDVSSWVALRAVFEAVGRIDLAFANAGVSEETDYFADTFDAEGQLQEPAYGVLHVNLRGVLNLVKLAWSSMRKNKVAGSIVITTSATAYAPEQSLPVYAGGKLAVSCLCFTLYLSTTPLFPTIIRCYWVPAMGICTLAVPILVAYKKCGVYSWSG